MWIALPLLSHYRDCLHWKSVSCTLHIGYTAALSFCRRYPTGRWNGAVSPTSSTLAHDLCVILLVSWIVSAGCALDYDLLVSFPPSGKPLALANTLVLPQQPVLWCCPCFSSAARSSLSLSLGLCLCTNWSSLSSKEGSLAGTFNRSQWQFCCCCFFKHILLLCMLLLHVMSV